MHMRRIILPGCSLCDYPTLFSTLRLITSRGARGPSWEETDFRVQQMHGWKMTVVSKKTLIISKLFEMNEGLNRETDFFRLRILGPERFGRGETVLPFFYKRSYRLPFYHVGSAGFFAAPPLGHTISQSFRIIVLGAMLGVSLRISEHHPLIPDRSECHRKATWVYSQDNSGFVKGEWRGCGVAASLAHPGLTLNCSDGHQKLQALAG